MYLLKIDKRNTRARCEIYSRVENKVTQTMSLTKN